MLKIAVIGGGASGITAAITAARNSAEVTVYERMDRIGKKILATGNGRCNYTNKNCTVSRYHGQNPEFIIPALKAFGVPDTVSFFDGLGMLTRFEPDGKAYPYSYQASAVLDVLRFSLDDLNVKTVLNFEVSKILKTDNGFIIKSYDGREAYAQRVILASGGRASSFLGSNGSGYEIAKDLGHTITEVFPSLVQIKTDTAYVKALKGIKIDARVTFCAKDKIFESIGEVLFTEYGLSGPAIFDISRHCGEYKNAKLKLDLLYDMDYNRLVSLLRKRRCEKRNLENFFVGILNKKLGMTIMKYANLLPYSRPSSELSDTEIFHLADCVKEFSLEILGTMSWNNAQVTAGGIDCAEIDAATMQSKLVKGLYICGEVADIDGDCGGFNLQWAWSSGYVAGKSAVNYNG